MEEVEGFSDDTTNQGSTMAATSVIEPESDEATMRIHLPSNTMPSCIEISCSDINYLNAVIQGTSISSSPPEHIHNLILGIRMPNGLVNRSDFEALMPLMANDGDDMPNALVQSTLGMIFDSYDRQQAGVADFDEIAV